jgi:hypothetical protein
MSGVCLFMINVNYNIFSYNYIINILINMLIIISLLVYLIHIWYIINFSINILFIVYFYNTCSLKYNQNSFILYLFKFEIDMYQNVVSYYSSIINIFIIYIFYKLFTYTFYKINKIIS